MRYPASGSTDTLSRCRHSSERGLPEVNGWQEAEEFTDLDGFEQSWLAAGSLVAVGLLALAALSVFGTWISLAVLLLGTVLAVIANPSVWIPDRETDR